MIIRINPDLQKASSLKQTAMITYQRLSEIDKEKYPSNTLTDYYEIIRKLMESLNSIEGIKFSGEGAQYEVIEHTCKSYGIKSLYREFLQAMRDYRNRILMRVLL